MSTSVEYLLIVQKADTFCDSVEAFNQLLQVDSAISVKRDKLQHSNTLECDYRITMGEISGKEQRFFHVKFSIEGATEERIDQFTELLKSVRTVMNRLGNQPETLWDDISFYYAKQAYEHIYRIENLMRKLIANFMLVTIGKEWISETSPKEFVEAIASSKRKEYLNVLDTVDFIHLSAFLLRPYSKKDVQELYSKIRDAKTADDLAGLKEFMPVSNWARYFSALVECDDSYLQKRWNELYELRCKVAHNAIVNKTEFLRINTLIEELETKLVEAIKKLPKLQIPDADVEQIAENAASNLSELVGDFIAAWRILEGHTLRKASEFGVKSKMVRQAVEVLLHNGVLTPDEHDSIMKLSALKNHLVHPTGVEVPANELRHAIKRMLRLIPRFGYIEESSSIPQSGEGWDAAAMVAIRGHRYQHVNAINSAILNSISNEANLRLADQERIISPRSAGTERVGDDPSP